MCVELNMVGSNLGADSCNGYTGYKGAGNFIITSVGINAEGDHYCSRDYGPSAANRNAFHYIHGDGSYYYCNPDGSTYYNNGRGRERYEPPGTRYGNSHSDSD